MNARLISDSTIRLLGFCPMGVLRSVVEWGTLDRWRKGSGGWNVDGLSSVWMLGQGCRFKHFSSKNFWFEHFSCFYFCSLCTRDSSSLIVQTCVMPKDCQTSDWSPWSPCSKTCRSTDLSPGYRLRSRMVTQIPIGGGKQCATLEEKEACNIIGDLLSNCPRYSAQWWSSHFQAHRPWDKANA